MNVALSQGLSDAAPPAAPAPAPSDPLDPATENLRQSIAEGERAVVARRAKEGDTKAVLDEEKRLALLRRALGDLTLEHARRQAGVTSTPNRLGPKFFLIGLAALAAGLILGDGWIFLTVPGFGTMISGLWLSRSRSLVARLFAATTASLWTLAIALELSLGPTGINNAFADPLAGALVRLLVWLVVWIPLIGWIFLPRRIPRLLDRFDAAPRRFGGSR